VELVADRSRIATIVVTDRADELGSFDIETGAVYPLGKVADAQRHSDSAHVRGKIVLVPEVRH
jgi:hypothetical protein